MGTLINQKDSKFGFKIPIYPLKKLELSSFLGFFKEKWESRLFLREIGFRE